MRAVATDSFRLVEVTKLETTGEAIPDTMMRRESLKAVKTLKADTTIEVETVNGQTLATPDSKKNGSFVIETLDEKIERYPVYQTIKDEAEKCEYIEVVLAGDYLAEIAAFLGQFQPNSAIKLRVPLNAKDSPVILEARSKAEAAYALLMPIKTK